MSEAVITVHMKPYSDCTYCDGRGILLGPYDPDKGRNDVRECGKCNGWGIKINRSLQKALGKMTQLTVKAMTRESIPWGRSAKNTPPAAP